MWLTEMRGKRAYMWDSPSREDVIWITEAMVTYRRSRDWFNRRIQKGRLRRIGLPGEAKVYLLRAEVERVLREDDRRTE